MIERWVSEGMDPPNREWEVIYSEWYAKDESAAANDHRDFLTED